MGLEVLWTLGLLINQGARRISVIFISFNEWWHEQKKKSIRFPRKSASQQLVRKLKRYLTGTVLNGIKN